VKILAIAFIACMVWSSVAAAAPAANTPHESVVTLADAQEPMWLPRRFRNHCGYDLLRSRFFCSNHCGIGYQFYYCHPESFGCCHVGRGYCAWDGSLRCTP
jgi:hypothetical protein